MDTILILIACWFAFTIFHFQNLYMIRLGLQTWRDILFYAVWNIPLHFIGFILIVYVFHAGYQVFNRHYWALIILVAFIQRLNNVIMVYAILGELPRNGTLVGLALVLLAVAVTAIWK